ncbi:hypothetical protein, conserved [Angomonas deanei]|uniref:Uncharacterized protein n=1 Tax=Angomonas deanei TaxID=59799 RepID=A0A7G2C9Z5_9TRYP|nr:hypothetical protein, conserved [Angomonas deanei]
MRKQSVALQTNTPDEGRPLRTGMEAPATDVVHRRSVALQFDGPEQSPLYFEEEVVPAEEVEAAIGSHEEAVGCPADEHPGREGRPLRTGMEAPATDVVHRRSVALQFDGPEQSPLYFEEEVVAAEEVEAAIDRMRKQSVALQTNTPDDGKTDSALGWKPPPRTSSTGAPLRCSLMGPEQSPLYFEEEVVAAEEVEAAIGPHEEAVGCPADEHPGRKGRPLRTGMEAPTTDVVHRRSVALQFDGPEQSPLYFEEEVVPAEEVEAAIGSHEEAVGCPADEHPGRGKTAPHWDGSPHHGRRPPALRCAAV